MKVIIHDLDDNFHKMLEGKCDSIIRADGKYAPCQGCFGCWTKHPARCFMKDSLMESCRTVGRGDPLIIISRSCYGGYSPAVKNIIDQSNGESTPFSTYRGGQMHHTLRYGKRKQLRVISYGEMTDREQETFRLLTERNRVNCGFETGEFTYVTDLSRLEEML